MIVDLREFERFPVTTILEAQPGEIEPFSDVVSKVDWVQVRLQIQKTTEEYFCHGEVRAGVHLDCARCARVFATEIGGETDFIIRSSSLSLPTEDRGVPDDEDYVLYRGNDLRADVTDQVRQTLVLAVEMKPLCQEECRGLCPTCGTNLNEAACDCHRSEPDPRWDGLKDLLGT